MLDHRWYLSERAGHDVGTMEAAVSYVADVLAHKPDERAVLGVQLGGAGGLVGTQFTDTVEHHFDFRA